MTTTDQTRATIEAIIARLQDLLDHPPAEGYSGTYDVFHIGANYHPSYYDDTTNAPDGAHSPTDGTFDVTTDSVSSYEDMPGSVHDLTSVFCESMTQAVVIIRRG